MNKDMNELATICTRYAELRNAAKTAQNNLVKFRFEVFSDMITLEELSTLKVAENIIERIASNTSQSDAMKYFNSIPA